MDKGPEDAHLRPRRDAADAFAGEQRVRAQPFEAIELDLALLWSR